MNFKNISFVFLLSLLLFASIMQGQFYYGSQQEFGKNRVQYDDPRLWTWYKFERFDCYFYKNGKEIAEYICREAASQIKEIEKLFDYNLDEKIMFVVYNKQSEFRQSNLGLVSEEQTNIGGVTRIVGSKIALYFEGDYNKLNKQIRSGIAEVLLNQMMYGGSMKDVIKNATFLNLPEWYVKGIVEYASEYWSTGTDNLFKDGMLSGKYWKFTRLEGDEAKLAGHSVWKYIADIYGENVIANVLYMTKITRSVESAFNFVLGVSIKTLSEEWKQYYLNFYSENGISKSLPLKPVLKKPKSTRTFTQFKISPDGKKAVFATNEFGQYKVWLHDFEKNKTKRVFKRDKKIDRIIDYSYPLLTWHPSGKMFVMLEERKGEIRMYYYTIETKEREMIKLFSFEKVLDIAYSSDGKKIVMSAINLGKSDIYVYNIAGGAVEQITNDIYSDVNPRFINNDKKIVFSSNRPYDSIKSGYDYINKATYYNDLFIYDYSKRSVVLKRIISTPYAHETMPSEYDNAHISYLSDENGVVNRYVAGFDSVIAFVDTAAHYRYITSTAALSDYPVSLLEQDISVSSGKISEIIFTKGRHYLFVEEKVTFENAKPLEPKISPVKSQINKKLKITGTDSLNLLSGPKTIKITLNDNKPLNSDTANNGIDINNYRFEPEIANKYEKPKEKKNTTVFTSDSTLVNKTDSVPPKKEFVLPVMRNYFRFYGVDYMVTQIDNSFLSSNYQPFAGYQSPGFYDPGLNALFKISLSDLLEDYKILAGMRFSGDLQANEYFLSYFDRRKLWDKTTTLHRQALLGIYNNEYLVKLHTHEIKYQLKYPFNEVSSLRGSVNGRLDRIVFLSRDQFSLPPAHEYDYWANAKLEYVYDDTRPKGLNLYNGLRYKLFLEYYRKINDPITDIYIAGFDARHYLKVHRSIIWANRLSGSTSLGKHRLLYYMGGVDNWLFPKFNQGISISKEDDYVFQTIATPVRGFWRNQRNGTTFLLWNTEFRVPVFRYFANRPIKNDFFNNFQLLFFGDIGTAWTGKTPFSENNSSNTVVIGANGHPVVVTLLNQREPVIGGFGYGVRSRLLGYFFRVDWAWGVENRTIIPKDGDPENGKKASITYVSLSLDF